MFWTSPGRFCAAFVWSRRMGALPSVEASQLQAVIANVPGVVYRCRFDADWTMELISDGIARMTGFAASDFSDRRRSYEQLIHPDDRAMVRRAVSDGVEERRPFSCEYRIVTAEGGVRWVLERGRPSTDDAEDWLDGVIFDVSERKVLEEELRRSLAEEAAATERLWLARDLHDSVGHALSIGTIQAAVADRSLAHDPEAARAALAAVQDAMRQALHDMREMVGAQDEAGAVDLEDRVEGLVRSAERSGVHVRVISEGERRPQGAAIAASLYRTIQECLTNCAKHAHGAQVTVSIRTTDDRVELTVSDDGTGCASPANLPSGGRGLDNVRTRAHSLGGTFHAGPDGAGFAVTVSYPTGPGAA